MAVGRVRIEGLDDVTALLRGLPRKVQNDVLRVAANKAGSILREWIRHYIVAGGLVDTGKLYDSITIRARVDRTGVTASIGTGKAFYGLFHEFGWHSRGGVFHSPTPFMRPALTTAAPEIIRDVGAYIGKGIEVVATKAFKVRKR